MAKRNDIYSNEDIKWVASAVKTDLACGSAAEWYRKDNADACRGIQALKGPVVGSNGYRQWYGYYAQVGWHNPMADFRSNDFEGSIVDGPFATRDEAVARAAGYLREQGVPDERISVEKWGSVG